MIIVKDDFISKEDCIYVVEYYLKNNILSWQHDFQRPISIYKDQEYQCPDEKVNLVLRKIQEFVQSLGYEVKIHWSNLVRWPISAYQEMHLDKTDLHTNFTSILYLNDNFRGGETYLLDGTRIAPVAGRIVCFDGNKYPHAVSPVVGGDRYTIAIWYKDKE